MSDLDKYVEMLGIIDRDVAKIKIKTSDVSVKASATLYCVALDHANGIKDCLVANSKASAFALLRVLFETYVRGMWLEKCANDTQLSKFINEDKLVSNENKKITFRDMVLEVETAHGLPEYLSEIAKGSWSGLNSLTHSGSIQLHNNFNGKAVKSQYGDNHIAEAIEFATFIAALAYEQLCSLATGCDAEFEQEELIDFVKSWLNTSNHSKL